MTWHNHAIHMLHITHSLHDPHASLCLIVSYASGINCNITSYPILDGYFDILITSGLYETQNLGISKSGKLKIRESQIPGNSKSGKLKFRESQNPGNSNSGKIWESQNPGNSKSGNLKIRETQNPGNSESGKLKIWEKFKIWQSQNPGNSKYLDIIALICSGTAISSVPGTELN